MKLNDKKKTKKISIKTKKTGSHAPLDKKKLFLVGGITLGCVVIATIVVLALYFTNVIGAKEEPAVFAAAYMLDCTEKYDGTPKSVVARGLPEGTDVAYTYSFENSATGSTESGEGNSFVESGTYSISATLKKSGYTDRTLSATLHIIRDYTVTFRQEGFPDRTYTVAEGGTLGYASVPSPFFKNGFTCIWDNVDMNNITQDIVVECKQLAYTYSIEYWERGGVFDTSDGANPNPITYTVLSGNFELENPTREDAIFAGWFDESGNHVTEVKVNGCRNMLLKAKWISVTQSNADISLSKSEDELSWVVGEYPPIEREPYVQPVVDNNSSMESGEKLTDTDPADVPSNEDPTETDGTQVETGGTATTGNGEKVKVDDPSKVDVGGEKEPDKVEVEVPDPEKPGAVVVVEKTLEEIDAEEYVLETADSSYLIIAEKHENKAVTKILDSIYSLDENGERVYVKHGVFCDQTFVYAYMSDNITYIGSEAFRGCANLREVRLSENLSGVGAEAFRKSGLVSIDVSMLDSLSDNMFTFCQKLESIELSETLVSIGNECFKNCFSLKQVELPSTLTSIGKDVFSCCLDLKRISFDGTALQWAALLESNGGKANIGLSEAVEVICLK